MSTAPMTTTAAKATDPLLDLFQRHKHKIESSMVNGAKADRFIRIMMNQVARNPKLKDCTTGSLFICALTMAELDLSPLMGEAYLVPYGRECTLIIGYLGMIALSRRSGLLEAVSATPVYEGEFFEYEMGMHPKLRHIPNINRDPKAPLVAVYARTTLKGVDEPQIAVMSKQEIDDHRGRSKASGSGPWVTDYAAMAMKTVLRTHMKFLPKSVEMQRAEEVESDTERGVPQRLDYITMDTAPPAKDLRERVAASAAKVVDATPSEAPEESEAEEQTPAEPETPQADPAPAGKEAKPRKAAKVDAEKPATPAVWPDHKTTEWTRRFDSLIDADAEEYENARDAASRDGCDPADAHDSGCKALEARGNTP